MPLIDLNQLGSNRCRLLSGGDIVYASTRQDKSDDAGFVDTLVWKDWVIQHPLIISLLDENGNEIKLKSVLHRWRPGLITTLYIANSIPHFQVEVRKAITPNGIGVCEISCSYEAEQQLSLHLIVWTQQPRPTNNNSADYVQKSLDLISWEQRDFIDRDEKLFIAIGADRLPDSWLGLACEPVGESGDYETSGLPEQFSNGSLSRWFAPAASPNENLWVTFALHYRIQLDKDTPDMITASFSINDAAEECEDDLRDVLFTNPIEKNDTVWDTYLSQLPSFLSNDNRLDATCRWRQILLNSYPPTYRSSNDTSRPTSREAFSDRATAHSICDVLRERCWLSNHVPLQIAIIQQMHNHISHPAICMDYGRIALQSYQLTLDKKWAASAFQLLREYTNSCTKQDSRESLLFDVENACFHYNNCSALEQFARILGETEEATQWAEKALTLSNTIRGMWDPSISFFSNLFPSEDVNGERLLLKGYSPFASGLGTLKHLPALDLLSDPKHFGTRYPFPSVSRTSPFFSALGLEGGVRRNNPANGIICPHSTCIALEALAEVSRTTQPRLTPVAVDKMMKYTELQFMHGDLGSPVSFDHYNPVTGKPSTYLGKDCVLKGYPLDLIMRYFVGIIPSAEPDIITIHPLMSGLSRFKIQNLLYHNRRIDVQWDEDAGLEVRVNGWLKGSTDQLERLEVKF